MAGVGAENARGTMSVLSSLLPRTGLTLAHIDDIPPLDVLALVGDIDPVRFPQLIVDFLREKGELHGR
jgi:hypothetical protein